jgi:protein-S-isoprenylcysteine O-methyltransferase Ste14
MALFLLLWIMDNALGHPEISPSSTILKITGICLVLMGLATHVWAFLTLRRWWDHDELCTQGPFKYFRHPMYAAWITFMALGLPLLLNSWVFFLLLVLIHPIWHGLVQKEEDLMAELFGDEYLAYKRHTGRFLPRLPFTG